MAPVYRLALLLLGGHLQGHGQQGVYILDQQRLVLPDVLPAKQLGNCHLKQVRQGLEQGDVGQAQAPLPLAHRLVGEEQALRQLLLGHALLPAQLG